MRVGIDEDAEHPGGVNIFGKGFGNHDQDIILRPHIQGRQQPPNRESANHADGKDLAEIPFLKLTQGGAHSAKGIGEHRRQRMSLVGKGQAAWKALEQSHAQGLLECLYLMADGRLRDPKFQPGSGEAAVSCRSLEGTQGIKREL